MLKKLVARVFGFHAELESVRQEVEKLSHDDAFGILTRQGLMANCRKGDPRKAVIFLDFDRIHELNHELGYENVNKRIKAIFNLPVRSSDIRLGRWWSGDECVVLVDGDSSAAEAVLDRLRIQAQQQGLSFSAAAGIWNSQEEPLGSCVEQLAKEVMEQKTARVA